VLGLAHPSLQERLSLVCVQVLLLVADLIKLFRTAIDGAMKWLLRGIYSLMIEEIVPFPEELATETVVTSEQTREAGGQRVCKLEYSFCFGMYLSRRCEAPVVQVSSYPSCRRLTTFICYLRTIAL
jgi:hypothetical protein